MTGDANDFVLSLYRAGQRMRHGDLRPWIFTALQELLNFDSAIWFRGSGGGTMWPLQDWYVHGQSEQFLAEYLAFELWREDIAPLWKTADGRFRSACSSYVHCSSERLRCFMKRHRLEHLLTSWVSSEVPQMTEGVFLHRNEMQSPFSSDEATTAAQLLPHIVNAWREIRLRDMARSASSEPPFDGFSIAVLGPDLAVSESQVGFADLLDLEWPQWQGPMLPPELRGHVQAACHKPWSGKSIALYVRRLVDGRLLLLARRAHGLDTIAPRKRQVALLFSRGASQSQIARQLQLSPSTVNNYIGIVYEKLELRDKTDLSRLFVRLEP